MKIDTLIMMLIQYIIQLSRILSRRNVLYMMNVKMRAMCQGDEVVNVRKGTTAVRFIKDSIDERNLEGSPGS